MEDNSLLVVHGGNENVRAFAAIKILQKYIPKTLLLSGGVIRGKKGRTEAEILKNKILSKADDDMNLEDINIILEKKSVDTRGNVKNTFKKIGSKIDQYSKIIFLTSFGHAERVKIIFKKELAKFCKRKGFDNDFKEEILLKTEFINADEMIINNRFLWTKDERIEHRDFFKKVKKRSKEKNFVRKERFLRIVTGLPYGLKLLNRMAKKERS